jgi:hypothetical protein
MTTGEGHKSIQFQQFILYKIIIIIINYDVLTRFGFCRLSVLPLHVHIHDYYRYKKYANILRHALQIT